MPHEIKKLNRFTTIPFLIDLLHRKKLTLLDPSSWEDYNDRKTLEMYKQRVGAKSIYALCLTEGETIHHWNAFANGTNGCCIEFSPQKLFSTLENIEGMSHGKTEYVQLRNLGSFDTSRLPYYKRHAFQPEKEYRIIATSTAAQKPVFETDIDLSVIRRITISSKVPETVFRSLKQVLRQVSPEFKGRIYHSTLFDNKTWADILSKENT